MVTVSVPVMRAASAIAPASPRGMLHTRAEIVAHPRSGRLLFLWRNWIGVARRAGFGRNGIRLCREFVLVFVFLSEFSGRGDHSFAFRLGFFRFDFQLFF